MIAVDTSSLVAFLTGAQGVDVERLRMAATDKTLLLPPPVVSEILSRPRGADAYGMIGEPKLIDLTPGYWERAGTSRAFLLSKGLKAKLADALVAQCCIDADVALITRDTDYRHFARWCGLRLAVES